jgi:acylphosphatase
MSERLTLHLAIRGRVQGVGFRYAMLREAEALGLAGWVRNCRDGSVEAVIHGSPAAIEILRRWAERGPEGATVTGVLATPAEGSFERFEMRPTA